MPQPQELRFQRCHGHSPCGGARAGPVSNVATVTALMRARDARRRQRNSTHSSGRRRGARAEAHGASAALRNVLAPQNIACSEWPENARVRVRTSAVAAWLEGMAQKSAAAAAQCPAARARSRARAQPIRRRRGTRLDRIRFDPFGLRRLMQAICFHSHFGFVGSARFSRTPWSR